MKVILLEDIERLGTFGSTVRVADGYARNYLLPRGLALKFTPQNEQKLQAEKKTRTLRAGKDKEAAEVLAVAIGNLSCTIAKQVGENDRLFGSVTSMDIARSLLDEGLEVDKKCILLDEPLKSLGIYTVSIKLHPEVVANLKLWVVKT